MSRFEPQSQRLWHKLAEVSRDAPPVVHFDSIAPICDGCEMHQVRLMVGSAVLVVQMDRQQVARLINGASASVVTPAGPCRRDTCPGPVRIGGLA